MFDNRPSFLANIPPVTRNLLIINVLLWLATLILQQKVDLISYLGMFYWQSEYFNPAQIITYMFMHDPSGMVHIGFNMFGLYMFGRIIEQVLGSKRFLFFYIISGIGAAVLQQVAWTLGDPGLVSVGASGAIFALLGAFRFYYPNEPLYFMFIPVPIKAKIMVPILIVVELFFGVANFKIDNIAHYAHLGGLLVGLIVLWYWRRNPLNRIKRL